MAEARQGLVELSAFSFVPVLEGLMRMIENLQEVRAVPSAVTHMHTGHPPALERTHQAANTRWCALT